MVTRFALHATVIADVDAKFRYIAGETLTASVYASLHDTISTGCKRSVFFAGTFIQSLYIRYPVERDFGQSRKSPNSYLSLYNFRRIAHFICCLLSLAILKEFELIEIFIAPQLDKYVVL